MESTQNNVLHFYTESNPNPNSLKFVANRMLIPEGLNRDFPSLNETEEAPLAKAIFEKFSYVTRVFYMSNFVTITKENTIDWYEVKNEIQRFIKEFLENGGQLLTEDFSQSAVEEIGDEIESKIKGVLEEYIKPAVEMDGGAIAFEKFDGGKVTVSLQGSCSGCPSSTITLKSGIENLLKRMVPEVTEVIAEEA